MPMDILEKKKKKSSYKKMANKLKRSGMRKSDIARKLKKMKYGNRK